MRARDKLDFPTAKVAGTYGCCKCGNYCRLKAGERLACSLCRSPRSLVLVHSAASSAQSPLPQS
jgi:hypothetical protein